MHRFSGLSGLALLVLALLAAACVPIPATSPSLATNAPTLVAPTAPSGLLATVAAPTGAPASAVVMTPTVAATGASPATFSDPFAYCGAVGTVDTPDARYTGPKIPAAIVNGLQKALNLTGTPAPPIAQNSFWRCMGGKVYACTVGANLPCLDKADLSKTPTQGMTEYCQANPNADFIPAFVTGHNVVYEWQCKGGVPEAGKQVAQVDPQGFIANIWYQINP